MTIPICVNRKLLRMKSTAKQENNRNFEKNIFFSLICSGPSPGGLQHPHARECSTTGVTGEGIDTGRRGRVKFA